jgi:hypothetical protein
MLTTIPINITPIKASFIKIIYIIIWDTIFSFYILYKAELALYYLRIFIEGSPIVILLIKFNFKLRVTLNKGYSLVALT